MTDQPESHQDDAIPRQQPPRMPPAAVSGERSVPEQPPGIGDDQDEDLPANDNDEIVPL